jgi:hypothetical protein
MLQSSLRSTLRWTAALALLFGIASMLVFAPRRFAEASVRTKPTQTKFVVESNRFFKTLHATERDYPHGDYSVVEFANTRIAVRNSPRIGWSGSGSVVIDTTHESTGYGGSHGEFSCTAIPGGCHCEFGNLKFDIVHGQLQLSGQTFDVKTHSQAIVLDRSLAIESVHSIPSNMDAPEWDKAEIG